MTAPRPRPLNMLQGPTRPVWPLQTALAVVVMITVAMGWSLWGPTARQGTTASIGSQLEASPGATGSPEASQSETLKPVWTDAATGAAPGLESDTVRFYQEHTGRAYQVRLRDGSVRALSDAPLKNFVTSWWVPGRQEVISKFDDGSVVVFRWYSYATAASAPIAERVNTVAVSPDGQSLAFVQSEVGQKNIVRSAVDGSGARVVLPTRALDVGLYWQNNDTLALTMRRSADGAKDLLLLHADGSLIPLFTGKQNLETAWSRDGAWLLYSRFDEHDSISLRLYSMADGTDVDTGVRTSAAKCAWSPDGTFFVCGVPSAAALAKDVPAELTATNDSVVSVARDTFKQTMQYPAVPRPLTSVAQPFISSSGAYIVFRNLFDKKLYSLPLH